MKYVILYNFVRFHNFALSYLAVLKFFGIILDSFEHRQFWTHNTKAMANDKKVNITVIYFPKCLLRRSDSCRCPYWESFDAKNLIFETVKPKYDS